MADNPGLRLFGRSVSLPRGSGVDLLFFWFRVGINPNGLAQVQGEWAFGSALLGGNRHEARGMPKGEEPRCPSAFGLAGVDREGVERSTPWVGGVIGAATDR